MKLGSLFSGAGTCEYAALFWGVEPVWSSEIEKFPVSVTDKRFPHTRQLGDITLINGAEIEPVDIIAFGSPCQDLSVAGAQQGMTKTCPGCNTKGWASELEVCPICAGALESTRSGLFLEAIRIIREMREATNGKYPRFILWENVPGAFSSQKGEDFRTVLEKICRLKSAEYSIPRPKKWTNAGNIVADSFSIAWRVLNAQFWGVPQRRRRIFLVADFGGQRAGEICFKPESLSWHSATRQATRERTSGAFAESVGAAIPINTQVATRHKALGRGTGFGIGEDGDPMFTLQEAHSHAVFAPIASGFMSGQGSNARSIAFQEEVSPTLRSEAGGNSVPSVLCAGFNGHKSVTGDICYAEDSAPNMETKMPPNVVCAAFDPTQITNPNNRSLVKPGEPCFTLGANAHPPAIIYAPDVAPGLRAKANLNFREDGDTLVVYDARGNGNGNVSPAITGDHNGHISDYTAVAIDCRNYAAIPELSSTLQAKAGGGTSLNYINPVVVGVDHYVARRLTPTECARLQGMPDWWCADVPHKDAPEYRLWGNGMAFPCVLYLMENLAEETAIRIMEEALV